MYVVIVMHSVALQTLVCVGVFTEQVFIDYRLSEGEMADCWYEIYEMSMVISRLSTKHHRSPKGRPPTITNGAVKHLAICESVPVTFNRLYHENWSIIDKLLVD